MRKSLRALAAASMATLGLLALSASPARAVPTAPVCTSAASAFSCSSANAGQTTWTLTFYYSTGGPITTQWRTPGPTVSSACYNPHLPIVVRYSMDSGGGLSPSVSVTCTP
jgi:hypothetical protein